MSPTYVFNQHGTAEFVFHSSTRTVTRTYTDPYDSPRGTSPTWSGDHGFLNKPVDATGLVQVGARYYDPVIGRFVSVDPVMDLTDPQQWHGYAYAGNNPVTYSDPSGLRPQEHDGQASKGEYQPRTGVPSWAPVPAAQTTRTVAPPVRTSGGRDRPSGVFADSANELVDQIGGGVDNRLIAIEGVVGV